MRIPPEDLKVLVAFRGVRKNLLGSPWWVMMLDALVDDLVESRDAFDSVITAHADLKVELRNGLEEIAKGCHPAELPEDLSRCKRIAQYLLGKVK